MYNEEYYTSEELYHYGVLGMKWGIRRAKSQLRKAEKTGDTAKRDKALSSLDKHRTKINNKTKKLESKIIKLENKRESKQKKANTYAARSAKLASKNVRYERQLAKATAEKAKYDLKLAKQLQRRGIILKPNQRAIARYTMKSSKNEMKINQAKSKIKYNKYYVKSQELQAAADKARLKVDKNENLKRKFNKGLSDINDLTINKGRSLLAA